MTENVIAFVVVLDATLTNKDAEDTIRLLSLIRGVSSVRPVGKDIMTEIARDRARMEIREGVMAVLFPE